jgi:SAM-dependent methyltransferase
VLGTQLVAAAQQAAVPIRVVDGTADALPSPDAGMDAAVASLVLCSVPDQARALAELRRVLRPGGELRFFEHIQAGTSGLARAQRLADVIWPICVGGCHTSRDTLTAITTAGFHLTAPAGSGFPTAGRRRQPRRTCSGSAAAYPNPDQRGAIGSTSAPPRQL